MLEALGLLTAIVGALFCFRERHVKRLLAFSTISHSGLFLTGIALLTPLGLAGAAVYVAGHALVKAALFLCVGVVLHRLGSVDRDGACTVAARRLKVTGVIFSLAALGVTDLPVFATWLGQGWIEDSGAALGRPWITVIFVASYTVLVGGAVLRVAGGVFYGLGDAPSEDPPMAAGADEETGETDAGKRRTPLTMIIPPALLVAAAVGIGVIGVIGRLGPAVQAAAVRFEDQAAYNAAVLANTYVTHPVAVYAAGASRRHARRPAGRRRFGGRRADPGLARAVLAAPAGAARLSSRAQGSQQPPAGFHSGVVNDYVTWIVLGLACLGGVFALIVS